MYYNIFRLPLCCKARSYLNVFAIIKSNASQNQLERKRQTARHENQLNDSIYNKLYSPIIIYSQRQQLTVWRASVSTLSRAALIPDCLINNQLPETFKIDYALGYFG